MGIVFQHQKNSICFQDKIYLKQCLWNNNQKMTSPVCSSQQFVGGGGASKASRKEIFQMKMYIFHLNWKVQSIPNAYWIAWCYFSFVREPFVHCQIQMHSTATFRGKVIKLLFCLLPMLYCSASEKESIALCWIEKHPFACTQKVSSDVYPLLCKTSEGFNN